MSDFVPGRLKVVPTGAVVDDIKIHIERYSKEGMEFDIQGISTAVANSLRRVMIAQLPSMAIEKVCVYNNTSVIPDKVLAHRLCLIPLKADPYKFERRKEDSTEFTEKDTLKFKLKIKCAKNPNAPSSSSNPDDLYINSKVFSKDIKWIPMGSQKSVFKESDVGPVSDDILINKLRPGQELNLKLYAVKGRGCDHAKFQPVCTAFYRLMPEIRLTRDITGQEAVELQKYLTPGLIQLEEKDVFKPSLGARKKWLSGVVHAKVEKARYEICSRNWIRHPKFKDDVKVHRLTDHIIFNVASAGSRPPDVLFLEAVRFMKVQCGLFYNCLQKNDF